MAQKWALSLARATDHLSSPVSAQLVRDVFARLKADYPHRLEAINEGMTVIGSRRIFGDGSYADIKTADAQSGNNKINIGVMIGGKPSDYI